MSDLLKTVELTKRFSGLVAAKNINISVEGSSIVGIIGPNGAGKTTLLNLVCGVYSPSSGKIYYEDKDVTGLSPHKLCERGISRTFQHPKPFPNHTVLQNVMVGAVFGRERESEKQAEEDALKLLSELDLLEKKNTKAIDLNHMELKKMEIARALAGKPHLLLLDEPAAGLTPTEVNWLIELIKKTNRSGIGIMLIEHILKAVMSLSSKIVVLNHGELIAEGTPKEIVNNELVIEAYLGEKQAGA